MANLESVTHHLAKKVGGLLGSARKGLTSGWEIGNLNEPIRDETKLLPPVNSDKWLHKDELSNLMQEKIQLEIKLAESLIAAGDYRVSILEKEIAASQQAMRHMIDQLDKTMERYIIESQNCEDEKEKAQKIIVDTSSEIKQLRFIKKYGLPATAIIGIIIGTQSNNIIKQFGYQQIPHNPIHQESNK
jgi:hypothetical protein